MVIIVIIIIIITFGGSFFFPPPCSHTLPGVTANVLAHLQAKTYSFPFQGCLGPPLPGGVWAGGHKPAAWLSPECSLVVTLFPNALQLLLLWLQEEGSSADPLGLLLSLPRSQMGSLVRERGPDNGKGHDVMLPMWPKSLCRYLTEGFRCREQNSKGWDLFWHASCNFFSSVVFKHHKIKTLFYSFLSFKLLARQNKIVKFWKLCSFFRKNNPHCFIINTMNFSPTISY